MHKFFMLPPPPYFGGGHNRICLQEMFLIIDNIFVKI